MRIYFSAAVPCVLRVGGAPAGFLSGNELCADVDEHIPAEFIPIDANLLPLAFVAGESFFHKPPACCDVYRCDWGKGVCLAKVQQRFGISPEETLCFGDYLNDVDMMPHAHYSYAMKNAHPGLKAVCRFETKDTNEQDGVVNTIAELLGITGI